MNPQKNKKTNLIVILLLCAAAVASYYFFKISSLFLIVILLFIGFKAVKIYDKIAILKKIPFAKFCIVNVIVFLWFVVFFGMFFESDLFYSNFGGFAAQLLKKGFGSIGSVIVLFSPLIFFVWKLCKKIKQLYNAPPTNEPQQPIENQTTTNVSPNNNPPTENTPKEETDL